MSGSARGQSAAGCGKYSVQLWQCWRDIHASKTAFVPSMSVAAIMGITDVISIVSPPLTVLFIRFVKNAATFLQFTVFYYIMHVINDEDGVYRRDNIEKIDKM